MRRDIEIDYSKFDNYKPVLTPEQVSEYIGAKFSMTREQFNKRFNLQKESEYTKFLNETKGWKS